MSWNRNFVAFYKVSLIQLIYYTQLHPQLPLFSQPTLVAFDLFAFSRKKARNKK